MTDNEPSQPERGRHPLLDPRPSEQPEARRKPSGVNLMLPGTVERPIVTYVLVVINAGIWLLNMIAPSLAHEMYGQGVQVTNLVIRDREVYRLLTAMFLHADIMHVFFNCMALFYIGIQVERFFGHARFFTIYILGGLAGSIISLFFSTAVLGASGAVFAIWGAEALFLYQHRQLFGEGALQRLRWTATMVLFNFFIGIVSNIEGTRLIANFAHLGGLVGGVILTWAIGPRFLIERIEKPQPGQFPVKIIQGNPLMPRFGAILFYCAGLAATLLLAILIGP